MINPFESLGIKHKEDPTGETVEGQFSCQEEDCWNVSKEARYLEEEEILTWICKDEHISKIEGFKI